MPYSSSKNAPPVTGGSPQKNGSSAARKKQLALIRRGGNVKRFHTLQIIGEQTVAAHSFGVVSIILLLHPNPSLALIKAAAWHDVAEGTIGDLPAPALWENERLAGAYGRAGTDFLLKNLPEACSDLTTEEINWLKAADKLDVYFFAEEQFALGNKNMEEILRNLYIWFNAHLKILPQEIADTVNEEMMEGG